MFLNSLVIPDVESCVPMIDMTGGTTVHRSTLLDPVEDGDDSLPDSFGQTPSGDVSEENDLIAILET